MHPARIASIVLRVGEFLGGAVVLGLVAFFLSQYQHYHTGPLASEIYTAAVSVLSVVLPALWMPLEVHTGVDFAMSAAWFTAFGLLTNFFNVHGCGGAFHLDGLAHPKSCASWNAMEAFCVISASLWLSSLALDLFAIRVNQLRRREIIERSSWS